MLGAERLLADRQRALIERPRPRKDALGLKQAGEVVGARRRIGRRKLGAGGRSRDSLKIVGREHFVSICFGKLEVGLIMVSMDAIDNGNARTAAGAAGEPRPGAYVQSGGGVRPGRGAAKAFSAEFWSNPLKRRISRKEINLDFIPKNLDFVPSGLDCVPTGLDFGPPGLDFVPPGLEILQCCWELGRVPAFRFWRKGASQRKGTDFGA